MIPSKEELKEYGKYALAGGTFALVASAVGASVLASAALGAGGIVALAYRNTHRSLFSGEFPLLYQIVLSRALKSQDPYEILAIADAFRLRGHHEQADQLTTTAYALAPSNWPLQNRRPPIGTKNFQGVAPASLQQWASSIVYDPAMTYGMTKTVGLGDDIYIARVEHHPWSTAGQQGQGGDPNSVVHGHYKGVTLYKFA